MSMNIEAVRALEELKEHFKEVQLAISQYAELLNQYELNAHNDIAEEPVDDDPHMVSEQITTVLDEVMKKDE